MINTKTKGELGNRIEYDVEHDLFHPQNVYSDEYITPTFIEYVRKLEKENEHLLIELEDFKKRENYKRACQLKHAKMKKNNDEYKLSNKEKYDIAYQNAIDNMNTWR